MFCSAPARCRSAGLAVAGVAAFVPGHLDAGCAWALHAPSSHIASIDKGRPEGPMTRSKRTTTSSSSNYNDTMQHRSPAQQVAALVEIRVLERIGSGTFGTVYRGSMRCHASRGVEEVAVKTVELDRNYINHEVEIMQELTAASGMTWDPVCFSVHPSGSQLFFGCWDPDPSTFRVLGR